MKKDRVKTLIYCGVIGLLLSQLYDISDWKLWVSLVGIIIGANAVDYILIKALGE